MFSTFVNTNASDAPVDQRQAVDRCSRLGSSFSQEMLSFQEYADNITTMIVAAPDASMEKCVATIPSDDIIGYESFLRQWLEPLDYMPDPLPFLTGQPSKERIAEMQKQMREKYLRLHEFVRRRAFLL